MEDLIQGEQKDGSYSLPACLGELESGQLLLDERIGRTAALFREGGGLLARRDRDGFRRRFPVQFDPPA